MMKKLLAAFFAGWLALGPAQAANQGSVSVFTTGPHSANDFAVNSLNPALLAIFTCSWGPGAPANGPGGVPAAYQCWADTSASPVVTFNRYDGTNWVAFGKLNTTTHIWTVVGTLTLAAPNGHSIGAASPGTGWGFYYGGTITASAGFAINWQTDAILTASANNDGLQAIRVSASVARAGKTGVEAVALWIGANSGGPYDFGIKITDQSPISLPGRIGVGFNGQPVAKFQINNNTATAVNRLGVLPDIMVTAADNASANVYLQPVAQSGGVQALRYNGTYASPTTMVANDQMLAVGAGGWDGTNESANGAFMAIHAAQTWTSTVHGSYMRFATTALGASAAIENARVTPSGSLSVGSAAYSAAQDQGAGSVAASGGLATGIPITKTGTSSTVGNAEGSTIFNPSAAHVVTLPSAASFPGRWWHAKLIAAFAVTSASSNIVPLAGGAATTTIFSAATAGKWAILQSDGTNWQLFAGN